ncbi:MAG: hypothetical protein J0H38_19470 [Rhizobiales bacterium]|nr:hypothetical protein [Hyphomicrobiales bacterium]
MVATMALPSGATPMGFGRLSGSTIGRLDALSQCILEIDQHIMFLQHIEEFL